MSDYYAFGMAMPGRSYQSTSSSYRYGYQGSEKDDEISGKGNSYTTFFRQLDPRLGRWFSPDPVFQPWQSPYTSMDNNPISLVDPKGLSADSSIYDENGDLLGTDDEGLEGDAIVMNKDDFQQGMSHEEAKKKKLPDPELRKRREAVEQRKREHKKTLEEYLNTSNLWEREVPDLSEVENIVNSNKKRIEYE